MSKAPERIWAWGHARDVCSAGQWQDLPCNHPEYVRADLVQAAVAAALTEAAERAHQADSLELATHGANKIAERILALITPDAQAALDRHVAKRVAEVKGGKNE